VTTGAIRRSNRLLLLSYCFRGSFLSFAHSSSWEARVKGKGQIPRLDHM
jgi:hypothetical protein